MGPVAEAPASSDQVDRRISIPGTFPHSLPASKPTSALASARGVNTHADIYIEDALADSVAAASAALARLGSGRISRSGSALTAQLQETGVGDALATLAALGSERVSRANSDTEDAADNQQDLAREVGQESRGEEQDVGLAPEQMRDVEVPEYTLSKLPSIPEQASMEDLAGLPSGASSAIRVA